MLVFVLACLAVGGMIGLVALGVVLVWRSETVYGCPNCENRVKGYKH